MSDTSSDKSASFKTRQRRVDRSRWRLAYFLLATFGALTVLLYLFFSHKIVNMYAASVEKNDQWIKRFDHISELETLAQTANQPANEVFLSRDIARERSRSLESTEGFAARFVALRHEFEGDDFGLYGGPIAGDLADIEQAMGEMRVATEQVFADLAVSDFDKAERRRAAMNGRYAALSGIFTELRGHVQLAQSRLLAEQSAQAAALTRFEFGVGILALILIGGATVYGHLISTKIKADERERDRYLDDLRDAREGLRLANSDLEARVAERTLALERANEGLRAEVFARESVESELREVLARARQLAAMVEFATDAVVGADLDGTITSWNRGAERMLGFRMEDILGKHMSTLLPEAGHDDFNSILESVRAGRRVSHFETKWRMGNGASVDVSLSVSHVRDAEGAIVGFSTVARDVTENRKAQDELLRAKSAAEAASRAKSEFLANMSHEIRTPMNGILGMTELALDTALNFEQREYLELVKISASGLLNVINDILDFSKIEAGRLELDPVEFGLRATIDDTMKTLALGADRKGLELAVDVADEVPERLVGDPGRLRQVLVNLVGNAVKFTSAGEVVVSISLDSSRDHEVSLKFAVTDTGIGIPAYQHESIFEAFTQVDGSTTRRFGGTGLGLTISSRLVTLMGGNIWVESETGRGSTFHFTVRLGVADNASAQPGSVPTESLVGLRALLVDDNAVNLQILDRTLARWGVITSTADSGEKALQKLEEAYAEGHPYSLVILDARMPGLDGFGVAERIRQTPSLAHATIMMLTSVDIEHGTRRCRELGITMVVTKPVRQAQLRDAILASIGTSQVAAAALPANARTGRSLRILLAEDNLINQRVAVTLLGNRGHEVVVVENGKDAVAAALAETFDAILMDVQMPEMDGFEATSSIRLAELSTGGHVPIIAMTAHAMKGDRERCLAAGMDSYMSKPIDVDRFLDLVEAHGSGRMSVGNPVLGERHDEPSLDVQATLSRLDGSIELLREVVTLFRDQAVERMDGLRSAVERSDLVALGRLSHALKGEAGMLGVTDLAESAGRIERAVREEGLQEACSLVAVLEVSMAHFLASVDAALEELEPPTSRSDGTPLPAIMPRA
jgi:two-component system, sensor histidine kinase and response regulator